MECGHRQSSSAVSVMGSLLQDLSSFQLFDLASAWRETLFLAREAATDLEGDPAPVHFLHLKWGPAGAAARLFRSAESTPAFVDQRCSKKTVLAPAHVAPHRQLWKHEVEYLFPVPQPPVLLINIPTMQVNITVNLSAAGALPKQGGA